MIRCRLVPTTYHHRAPHTGSRAQRPHLGLAAAGGNGTPQLSMDHVLWALGSSLTEPTPLLRVTASSLY